MKTALKCCEGNTTRARRSAPVRLQPAVRYVITIFCSPVFCCLRTEGRGPERGLVGEQGGHAGENAGPLARVASVGGHVAEESLK